jgi:hypothetical protein
MLSAAIVGGLGLEIRPHGCGRPHRTWDGALGLIRHAWDGVEIDAPANPRGLLSARARRPATGTSGSSTSHDPTVVREAEARHGPLARTAEEAEDEREIPEPAEALEGTFSPAGDG